MVNIEIKFEIESLEFMVILDSKDAFIGRTWRDLRPYVVEIWG